MTLNKLIVIACFALAPALLVGQNAAPPTAQTGLDPTSIAKPLGDSWPTYSGDYTGRRYSSLTQINQSNVTRLTLVYAAKVSGGANGGGGGFGGPERRTTIVGGEGTGEVTVGGATTIKGAVLMV